MLVLKPVLPADRDQQFHTIDVVIPLLAFDYCSARLSSSLTVNGFPEGAASESKNEFRSLIASARDNWRNANPVAPDCTCLAYGSQHACNRG